MLSPVERAAGHCDWVRALVDSGDIYQPLAWQPGQALALLRDVEALEQSGVVVRVPARWGRRRPPRAAVQVSVGGKPPGDLGAEALLAFDVSVVLDGDGDGGGGAERLSPEEIATILAGGADLVLLRGRWVEVDREGLSRLLDRWKAAEQAHAEGLPFHEALRLLSGAGVGDETAALLGGGQAENDNAEVPQLRVVPGPWLAEVLDGLRSPEGLAETDPGAELLTQLRPYQHSGVRWLWFLRSLGLGGVLADDMGLGKTVQVIALLLLARRHRPTGNGSTPPASPASRPSLVVAPASLLANWQAEIGRFAPTLRVLVAHPSAIPGRELAALDDARLAETDVVLTSYGTLQRLPALRSPAWDVVVADEAQMIKNAATQQARAMRALQARCRLALTGTPVENRLGDLWSIFAFSNPGLLGTAREFSAFVKQLEQQAEDQPGSGYGPLRALVQPYILRRLKTQKQVLADLPEKTEVKAFCGLSRKQTALYQQTVEGLARALQSAEGVERRGLVLSTLTRLKQICNHPSHWLRDGRLGSGGQRQAAPAGRTGGGDRPAPGQDAGVHPVPRGDRAAGPVPGGAVRTAGAGAVGTDRRAPAAEAGGRVPAGGRPAVLRAVPARRGHRLEPDRRQPRHPLRPLVEPRGGGSSHRPGIPHRSEAQRAGAQADLPGHAGRTHRRPHRQQEGPQPAADRDGRRAAWR